MDEHDNNYDSHAASGSSQYESLTPPASDDYAFSEEDWEEEPVFLSGEINSANTWITGQHFQPGSLPDDRGGSDFHNDDLFDPYRWEEAALGNGLEQSIASAYTEFGTELTPAGMMGTGSMQFGEASRDSLEGETGGIKAPKTAEGGRALGWTAVLLAVVSVFYWPWVLGPLAAAVGAVTYVRGSKALGAAAVALGLLSLFSYLFLLSY